MKAGVSPKAREIHETFGTWEDLPVTKTDLWSEAFATKTQMRQPEYVAFASDITPNGWLAGQGMYVYSNYRDDTAVNSVVGRALQMEGQGRGFIQFADSSDTPRGLESISFTARLGQFIEPAVRPCRSWRTTVRVAAATNWASSRTRRTATEPL